MANEFLEDQLQILSKHYDELATNHGYSHHAVQQSSSDTQQRRFEVLLQGFPDFKHKKILDFGCGAGHLFAFLKQQGFAGEYVGYDISTQLLQLARQQHPDARFEQRNILQSTPAEPAETFDLIFISGVFNNNIEHNQQFMQKVLKILFPLCRQGLAFNCLSTYVDFKAPTLYYFDPTDVFSYCKENITPLITLRHDYEIKPDVVPFEFSCYLKQSTILPRKNNYA
jgi:SAM-dependent methyltransferase